MRVRIPTPLRSYTDGAAEVEGQGMNLRSVLEALDAAHPGIKFRVVDEQGKIRTHIKFFVGAEAADDLRAPVGAGDEVTIICALSGG
jgi:molybdopterin synthase sulfur carrier subunit